MPDQEKQFGSINGINLAAAGDKLPDGKARRLEGIDPWREEGALAIRRGQDNLHTTAQTLLPSYRNDHPVCRIALGSIFRETF